MSLIGWFLSFGTRELVPTPACNPSAVARNDERGILTIGREGLGEGDYELYAPRWVEYEEIALPVLLNFVSYHCPGVPYMLEYHWHKFRHSYCPV